MNTIIISVGDELLSGDILNTNGQFIAQSLKDINIEVSKIYTIQDDIDSIIETVNYALEHSDIIIITGGLGPTDDDKTREGVAKALNYKLELDNNLLNELKELFYRNNYSMSDNNLKQAYKIENSISLKNRLGTAPGMLINKNNKKIFLLPGPPRELKPMFKEHVLKDLKEISNKKIYTKIVHTIGIGESQLEEEIKPFFNDKIQIGMYPRNGIVDIKVSSKGDNFNEAKTNVKNFIKSIEIDRFIWGYDEDTLENIVFNLLRDNNLEIGFAESLTGGLLSSNLTRLPGVSEIFPLSLITYSNNSKKKLLGVKKNVLNNYGAVSKEAAIEMARSLVELYSLDIGVSVTGIAGPTGATENKPVGLVYIGIADKYNVYYKKLLLRGSRREIQDKTSMNTFNEIRKFLLKY